MKSRYILIVMVMLLAISFIIKIEIDDSNYNNPRLMFNKILNFELPDTAVIENYQQNTSSRNCMIFYRIGVNENDSSYIESKLFEVSHVFRLQEQNPPYYRKYGICDWNWSGINRKTVEKEYLGVLYKYFFGTKRAQNLTVDFTNEKEGIYDIIYISYVTFYG